MRNLILGLIGLVVSFAASAQVSTSEPFLYVDRSASSFSLNLDVQVPLGGMTINVDLLSPDVPEWSPIAQTDLPDATFTRLALLSGPQSYQVPLIPDVVGPDQPGLAIARVSYSPVLQPGNIQSFLVYLGIVDDPGAHAVDANFTIEDGVSTLIYLCENPGQTANVDIRMRRSEIGFPAIVPLTYSPQSRNTAFDPALSNGAIGADYAFSMSTIVPDDVGFVVFGRGVQNSSVAGMVDCGPLGVPLEGLPLGDQTHSDISFGVPGSDLGALPFDINDAVGPSLDLRYQNGLFVPPTGTPTPPPTGTPTPPPTGTPTPPPTGTPTPPPTGTPTPPPTGTPTPPPTGTPTPPPTGTPTPPPADAALCPPTSQADPTEICVFRTAISTLETAGDLDVPVRRRGNSSGVATFDYRLIPDTAQAGVDYGDVGGTVSFADGETDLSVSVEIIENPGRTVDGSFIFEILNPVNAQIVPNFTQTRVNIIDVDDPDPNLGDSSISLITTEANVSENIGNVVLQVARMGDVSGAESVNFSTSPLDAIEGVDYGFTSGVLNWAAGDGASKPITVPIFDNTIVEGTRSFTVSLSNPLRGDIDPIGSTIVNILDDDAAPENAVIRMQQSVVSVSEDSGVANIGIGRFGNTSQPAQVIARTVSTGSAVLGTDITSRSQVIQWAAGDGEPKSLDVPIIDNDMPQDDRTFLVELVSPEGVTIGDPSSTLVTIVDDDEPGDRGTISFLSDIASVSEDAGSITLTLARFGDASSAASVVFSTADDLATSGLDYVQNTGLISWAAGESGVREITIDLIGNEVNDGNRTFLVSLNSPQGIDLGDNDSVLVTIIDNDAPAADPGILRITSDPEISVDRESGQVRITVERSGASGGSAAALLDLIPVNAVAGEDFDPAGLPALISWGPGENSARSVTIRLSTSDLLGEGTDGEFGIEPRQFIVTLTAIAPEGEPSALLPIVEPTADEVTVTIFTQEGPRNTGIGAGSMGGSSLLGFMLLSLIALRRRRLKAANAR